MKNRMIMEREPWSITFSMSQLDTKNHHLLSAACYDDEASLMGLRIYFKSYFT